MTVSLVAYLEQPNFSPRFLPSPANPTVATAWNAEIGSIIYNSGVRILHYHGFVQDVILLMIVP